MVNGWLRTKKGEEIWYAWELVMAVEISHVVKLARPFVDFYKEWNTYLYPSILYLRSGDTIVALRVQEVVLRLRWTGAMLLRPQGTCGPLRYE